jgi:hypothetical protein
MRALDAFFHQPERDGDAALNLEAGRTAGRR